MLRVVGPAADLDGDDPIAEFAPQFRAMYRAFQSTFGADLDALTACVLPRLAALEAENRMVRDRLEQLEERQRIDDQRHNAADLHTYRMRKEGVMPFLLDKAEDRLADGIEPEIIADELSVTVPELYRQLSIRREWKHLHDGERIRARASS